MEQIRSRLIGHGTHRGDAGRRPCRAPARSPNGTPQGRPLRPAPGHAPRCLSSPMPSLRTIPKRDAATPCPMSTGPCRGDACRRPCRSRARPWDGTGRVAEGGCPPPAPTDRDVPAFPLHQASPGARQARPLLWKTRQGNAVTAGAASMKGRRGWAGGAPARSELASECRTGYGALQPAPGPCMRSRDRARIRHETESVPGARLGTPTPQGGTVAVSGPWLSR